LKSYILRSTKPQGYLEYLEYFIEQFTESGDVVFDPFAGLGSTLFAAEKMGRVPFGIEADEQRYKIAKSHLKMKDNIILGDSRRMNEYQIPRTSLVFTSPIFMYSDETKNPLSGFKEDGTYKDYLEQIQGIFRMTSNLLKPGAKVVVEVYNLGAVDSRPLTLLAWDMARTISEVLRFVKEIIVCLQESDEDQGKSPQMFGYDHYYSLLFEK
jgi:hypothetical protein